jgi:hypothetical protein
MLAVPVIGSIGSLNVAVITGLLVVTLIAAFTGITAVTVGIRAAMPFEPKIGPLPLPPQLAANAPSATAIDQARHRGCL